LYHLLSLLAEQGGKGKSGERGGGGGGRREKRVATPPIFPSPHVLEKVKNVKKGEKKRKRGGGAISTLCVFFKSSHNPSTRNRGKKKRGKFKRRKGTRGGEKEEKETSNRVLSFQILNPP